MKQFLRYLDYLLSGLSGIGFVLTGVLLPSLIVALLGLCLLIANETPYGPYLKGPGEQSRMMIKEGWIDINTETARRMTRVMEIARAQLKKEMRKANRK